MPEHHLSHDTATAAATHAGELSASTYDYPPPVDRLQLPSRPAIPALLAPSAAPAASVPRRLSRPSLSPNPLAASTSSSPSPSQSPSRSPLRSRYHLPRTSSLLPPPRSPTQLDRLRTDSPSGSASSAQQGPQPTTHQQPYPYTAKSTALAASRLRDLEARRPQLSSSARPGSADSAELLNNELRETTETSRADHSQPSTEYEPRFTPLPPLELLPALDNSIGEPLASLLGQPTAPGFEPQGTPQGPPQDKMPHDHPRESNASSRHSKRRSSRSSGHDTEKPKSAKGPSQKAMLSRALQKANTAVQLDNAQNLEGARLAYAEACDLLQQVLKRTTADEDKRKLEAIRQTYASRIEELDQMGHWQGQDAAAKALPAPPGSDDDQLDSPDHAYPNGAAATGWNENGSGRSEEVYSSSRHRAEPSQIPRPSSSHRRRPSQGSQQSTHHNPLQSSFSRPSARQKSVDMDTRPRPGSGLPQPLNTQRPPSSPKTSLPHRRHEGHQHSTSHSSRGSEPRVQQGHLRGASQSSWLDAIGESGGSGNSSLHSRTSSLGYHRNHIRGLSGNTETEFDTALDAAIEAAYDDGYEPMLYDEFGRRESGEEAVAKVLRRVEIARERVRQTERETYGYTNGYDPVQRQQPQLQSQPQPQAPVASEQTANYSTGQTQEGFYDDNSSDEEERMLEEMARDYDIGDFTMNKPSATSASRPLKQSAQRADTAPDATAAAESSKVLKEKVSLSNIALGPTFPPPKQSLPELPPPRGGPPAQQSVRSRRLSGQNPKQLKIETTKLNPPKMPAHYLEQPRSATTRDMDQERPATATEQPRSVLHARSTPSFDVQGVELPPMSPPRIRGKAEADDSKPVSPPANKLRKNFSSSSLRSMKSRNMSLSNIDDGSDMSPSTPSSNQFGSLRTPAIPAIPTPLSSEFRDNLDSASTGVHLFDDHFHQPATPGSPDTSAQDPPVSLEPCPNDFMLRPFWLMRCLFQTLVHPRGGYVSTKLFVPRDVWRVKGVKLKNVDDKIANCDLLTAALMKLAHVDTCDADAVLEEMQSLEGVLEQVQTTLSRKLGNEVGLQGSGALFKDASAGGDADGNSAVPRSGSVSTKSSFSWRRLRSKSSGVGLGGAYNNKVGSAEVIRDTNSMPSLPMTQQPTSRPARRDVTQAQFIGPNANYMGSLARLFDAAQAIDEIARQVEDPGLRHADKTQVGLELCTRHAAEFFGFYICRFALNDMSLLMEKFIKRGSEWVLA